MIATLSIVYYIAVTIVSGLKTSFISFWIFTFISCVSLSILLDYLLKSQSSSAPLIAKVIAGCIWFAITCFLILESLIIYSGKQLPQPNADYAIVLGAQVRGNIPSKTLDMRIKAAAAYLKDNPNTKVICSGGQGSGELITEASAIKKGLMSLGIEEHRILLEEKSTNTVENLTFSMDIIDDNNADIVIITSNFHSFRAVKLAKKLGFRDVSSANANELMVTTPQYYVREFFAVIKDFLVGNL